MQVRITTRRLQTWIVASSAIGIFCVGVIIAAAGIYPLYDDLIKQEEKNLLLSLRTKTMAVEEYLARAKDIAVQISSRTVAREELEKYNQGQITLKELAEFSERILLDAMDTTQEVWGVTRLDAHNKIVVQVGLEIPEEAWPEFNPLSREASCGGPLNLGRRPYLVVTAPILNRRNELMGRDIMVFRLFQLERIVKDQPQSIAETIVGGIRNNEVELVFPVSSNGAQITNVPLDSGIGLAMRKTALKQTGILLVGGSDGHDELIADGPIRGSDWGLLLKMAPGELYASVNRHVLATCYLILFLLVAGTAGNDFGGQASDR